MILYGIARNSKARSLHFQTCSFFSSGRRWICKLRKQKSEHPSERAAADADEHPAPLPTGPHDRPQPRSHAPAVGTRAAGQQPTQLTNHRANCPRSERRRRRRRVGTYEVGGTPASRPRPLARHARVCVLSPPKGARPVETLTEGGRKCAHPTHPAPLLKICRRSINRATRPTATALRSPVVAPTTLAAEQQTDAPAHIHPHSTRDGGCPGGQ